MAFEFPGGIESIEIDDTGSFDIGATTDPSSFVVTIGKKAIAKEGTEFPDPEALTTELADDREGRTGLDQNLSIGAHTMDMTDFSTLETEALAHTDLFIRVTSQATNGSGNPLYVVIYSPVLLSDAKISPANVDREEKGAYQFAGMATGYRWEDIASMTQNS